MNAVTDIAEVYDLLYRLGFSATSTAFFHLSYAVYLAALNPHWLVKPSQRLYPEVADQYNANPLQVCLLYTSPSPRDSTSSRMPSSA